MKNNTQIIFETDSIVKFRTTCRRLLTALRKKDGMKHHIFIKGKFNFMNHMNDGLLVVHGRDPEVMTDNLIRTKGGYLRKIIKDKELNGGCYLVVSCYNYKRPKSITFENGTRFIFVRPEHVDSISNGALRVAIDILNGQYINEKYVYKIALNVHEVRNKKDC